MSNGPIIVIPEDEIIPGAKRVPVCICLDTERGMNEIWDQDLIKDGQRIYRNHKDEMKKKDGAISVDDLINDYYDELSLPVKKRYGMTKEEMKKRQADMETGFKQCKEVLKIFFKTLRDKRQPDIDVDVLVITFSGGEAQVFEPFTSGNSWDSDEWVDDLLNRTSQIEYKIEKSMQIGLKKAIDMLTDRTNSYSEQSIPSIRGRIVLLTRYKESEEEKTIGDDLERAELENYVESGLEPFKNICVTLGKSQDKQEDNKLAGLNFPDGTQFINPEKKGLEEVFKAISVSVSAGSDANIQNDDGDDDFAS